LPAIDLEGDELASPADAAATRAVPTPGAAQPPTSPLRQVTEAMRALAVVHDDATAVTRALRVPGDTSSSSRPVALIPRAAGPVRIPASPLLARRHPRARQTLTSAIMLIASAAIVVGVLTASRLAGSNSASDSPIGLVMVGANGTPTIHHEAWATMAGAFSLGVGGGAGPGVKAPGTAGLPVKQQSKAPKSKAPAQQPPPPTGIGVLPAPFEPWPPTDPWRAVPGHPAFAMQPIAGYYRSSFGQCTWWAQNERRDEDLAYLGNAAYWAAVATARGYRVGNRPAPNATVVFQPGVEGAGGGGHVAHVLAVYPNGWFLVSEMNFYWNGGGWGLVDYRYAHSGWGVQFIY
jgi:hypothetical protein